MEFLHKRNIDVMTGYKPENIINDIEEEYRFGTYSLNENGRKRKNSADFEKLYQAYKENKNIKIWLMNKNTIYGYTKIEKIENMDDEGLNLYFSKKKEDLSFLEEFIDFSKISIKKDNQFTLRELEDEEKNNLSKFLKWIKMVI